MDWSNERYVRLYTRDTTTMRKMPWQARCLFWELLRKVDRAGVLDLEGLGAEGLALNLGCPESVAADVLREWQNRGWAELRGDLLVIPSHIESQEAASTDASRKRREREARRDKARAHIANDSAKESPPVTDCHNESTQTNKPKQDERDVARDLETDSPDERASWLASACADHAKLVAAFHHPGDAKWREIADDLLGAIGVLAFGITTQEHVATAVRAAVADLETNADERSCRKVLRWKLDDVARGKLKPPVATHSATPAPKLVTPADYAANAAAEIAELERRRPKRNHP